MTIALPKVIEAYFAGDKRRDPEAVIGYFADDALVRDEGKTHAGKAAIRRWMAGASTQYSYTVEPLAIGDTGDRIVVTGRVSGNFPGSPVDLRYFFALKDDRIAALEIIP